MTWWSHRYAMRGWAVMLRADTARVLIISCGVKQKQVCVKPCMRGTAHAAGTRNSGKLSARTELDVSTGNMHTTQPVMQCINAKHRHESRS